jgi:hypothetical protein
LPGSVYCQFVWEKPGQAKSTRAKRVKRRRVEVRSMVLIFWLMILKLRAYGSKPYVIENLSVQSIGIRKVPQE